MDIIFADGRISTDDNSKLGRKLIEVLREHLAKNVGDKPPVPWMAILWPQLGPELRAELEFLAERGRVAQADLLSALRIAATDLRGLHIALSRVSTKFKVPYPIESRGTTANARRFWLSAEVATAVRSLAARAP